MGTAFKEFKNFAGGALNSGINDTATTMVLGSGQGSTFPASGDFVCILHNGNPDDAAELILVGGRSGDTLTGITRGYESTSAQTWSAGAFCQNIISQEAMEDIHGAINAIEDAGGFSTYTEGAITFGDTDGSLAEDPTKLFWDNTNNELGIGTNTPLGTLHVKTGSSGAASADSVADDLVIESHDHCGLSILAANTKAVSLWFGDNTVGGNNQGGFQYSTTSGYLAIRAGDSEAMRILSNGHVGIGDTTPDAMLHVSDGADALVIAPGTTSQPTDFVTEASNAGGLVMDNGLLGLCGPAGMSFIYNSRSLAGTRDLTVYHDSTAVMTFEGGDSVGRVGIGTASPAGQLHVAIDTGTINSDLTSQTFIAAVFSNTSSSGDHCVLAIQAGSNATAGIRFGDNAGSSYDGFVGYQTGSRYLMFLTAAAEHMRLGSTGGLMISLGAAITAGYADVILDLQGTGALLMPRVTTTERNTLTAQEGMMIYNETTQKLNFYNGSSWQAVTST